MGTQTSKLELARTIVQQEINLPNDLWIDYLCHGYLRKMYINLDDFFYEISLIQIISKFLANTFLVFDTYPPECRQLIRKCGTQFTRKVKLHDHLGLITIGCGKGWNGGTKHRLIIKSWTYSHMFDAFGIITNIKEFKSKRKWYTDEIDSDDYCALNGCCVVSKYKIPDYNRFTIRSSDCKPGDVIMIKFNGIEWNVSFWFNGEIVGEAMNITPNMTYYPFISSNEYNNYDAQYQLIYD